MEMTKIEITEGQPLSYTAHDGTVIVISVAGPIDKVYTLTINGDRIGISDDEQLIREMAREEAHRHNARAAGVPTSALCSPIDGCPLCMILADTMPISLLPALESPLPVDERQSSGLAGGGAAANAMSEPMRRKLIVARDNLARPGRIGRGGHEWEANVRMLRALARRGWLTLNDPIRPRYGDLTDAGRKALARELASTGGAR